MLEPAPLLIERGSTSDYVVAAVDRNPRYTRFAPAWVDFWTTVGSRTESSITPLVITVDGAQERLPSRLRPHVIPLDVPVDGPPALIAQVSRLVVPAHLPCGDRVVMTTDIDMMPLRPAYYDQIVGHARRGFVVARNVLRESSEYPMCYLLATAPMWRDLTADHDLVTFLDEAVRNSPQYTGRRGGPGWSTDQTMAFGLINGRDDLVHLSDEMTGHRRVDRDESVWANLVQTRPARILEFADYHARTPPRAWSWLHRRILRNLRTALGPS